MSNGTDHDDSEHPGYRLPGSADWYASLDDDEARHFAELSKQAAESVSHVIVARASLAWLLQWAAELMAFQSREIPALTASDEEYCAIVGRNLVRARRLSGISQYQLAERMGISHGTVDDYERGERDPTVADVRHLAAVLNVPVGLLVREWESGSEAPIRLHTLI